MLGPPAGLDPAAYRRGLGVLLVLYATIYGGLLIYTQGLPYVMDNNESFSSFVHASNLYHFPIGRTVGLTDEAFSPHNAAHPYVYTHQGNFPRLFAFVLYVLGLRTIETHIVITTFTVGLLAAVIMYRYFVLAAGAGFATIAAAIALTDYIFFVQWHVNTFRVWHAFFFYAALLCVHSVERRNRRTWLGATIATFAGLFYFELVFAAFVAVMCGLYAGWRYIRRPRLLLWCWTAQAAGAICAIAVLAGQLIGYLGWHDFLQDLELTYTARNVAGDPTYVERVRQFMETRHIAFWYNFANVEYGRSPYDILQSVVQGYFGVFTPTLWYCLAVVLIGWAVSLCWKPSSEDSSVAALPRADRIPGFVALLLLVVAFTRFLLAVVQPDAMAGVEGRRLTLDVRAYPWAAVLAAAVAIFVVTGLARLATRGGRQLAELSSHRVVGAAIMILLVEHLVISGGNLFDRSYEPVWAFVGAQWLHGWFVQLVVVGATLVAVLLAIDILPRIANQRDLAGLMICGLLAYAIIYALSPGYIHSGYLVRSAPFLSYVMQAAVALLFYVGWCALRWSVTIASTASARRIQRLPESAAAIGCGLVLGFLGLYWVSIQAAYAQLLPASHFMFIKRLAEPPFQGKSFVANAYAAPVYASTAQWAYFDTRLVLPEGGRIVWKEDGPVVNRDGRTYLWLADRDNPEYLRPEYFLCFQHQDLRTAVQRVHGRRTGCSSTDIVKDAVEKNRPSIAERVMARDESGADHWAIVKLQWNVQPPHTSAQATSPAVKAQQ